MLFPLPKCMEKKKATSARFRNRISEGIPRGQNGMRWSIGAFLMGCGTPAFVYGAVAWYSQKPRIANLVEAIVGLVAMSAGFLLIYFAEKRKK
jgi:hypothetical protein